MSQMEHPHRFLGLVAVWVGRLSPAPVVIEGVLAEESDAALAPVMESIS
jgi:hypothetical protein